LKKRHYFGKKGSKKGSHRKNVFVRWVPFFQNSAFFPKNRKKIRKKRKFFLKKSQKNAKKLAKIAKIGKKWTIFEGFFEKLWFAVPHRVKIYKKSRGLDQSYLTLFLTIFQKTTMTTCS